MSGIGTHPARAARRVSATSAPARTTIPGTAWLHCFAALDYLAGKVLRTTAASHTHVEWLAFLKQIDRETPPELALHLIVDNYATRKHAQVRAWLEKHPRFHLHFTPTASSWLNLVERFFRNLTVDVVRDGSFSNVRELSHATEAYLAERNLSPKPYRWRADGSSILAKSTRPELQALVKSLKGQYTRYPFYEDVFVLRNGSWLIEPDESIMILTPLGGTKKRPNKKSESVATNPPLTATPSAPLAHLCHGALPAP